MNKIEKLRESLTTLFTAEGEKFCCTPNEVRRLLITLDYGRLYHALCDEAEPVFTYCSAGASCSVHQYRASKLFYGPATLIWSDEKEPIEDEEVSTSYFHELWLLDDMTIAAASCFRMVDAAIGYVTEYREYKGEEWPAHIAPVHILELWQHLVDKYHSDDEGDSDDAPIIIYEP